MNKDTADQIKCFIEERRGYSIFILVQILVLFCLITGLFGKAVTVELDARNLEIRDEKVIVNEDHSFYISGWNDEESYGRWVAGTGLFDLKQGMYEVRVDYESLLYNTEVGGNCEDKTGTLQIFRTKKTEDKLCYNELKFQDGHTHQRTRLWIRNIGGEQDLQLMVNFYGVGELRVDKIQIRELTAWRLMRLLGWMVLSLLADAVYIYFFASHRASNKTAAAILLFAVFFASLPLMTDSLFWGHDLDFHLNRIIALANGLEAGHLFVPIQTEVLNGYGYATPLFYSQLFLYLPAVLYNLAVPAQVCYQIYAVLANIATCLIAYYSFRGIVRDNKIAAAGALVYLLSAYRITNLYVRAAVGEYTAMAFYPLIVYGFVRVYTTEETKLGIRDYLPIVLGLSGLIQSHVLSCELAAVFIAAVCLVYYRKTFAPRRFITLAKAAFLTLCANLAFILPFIQSMQMDIRVNEDPVNQIQVHGTYLQQVFSAFQVSFGDSRIGMNSEMSLSLGISLVMGLVIFAAGCSMQNEWRTRKSSTVKAGVLCTVFTVVCIVLSLRIFPWDSIENLSKFLAKVLCIVQFPWRYLSMATVFAAVVTVIGLYVVKEIKSVRTMQLLGGVLCLAAVFTNSLYMAGFTNGIGIERVYGDADVEKAVSSGEYILNGTIEGNLRWRRVNADPEYVTVSGYVYQGGVTAFDCVNTADTEMAVEIPLLNYDNYYAFDTATGEAVGIMNGTDNRVSLAIPAGFDGSIKVVYRFPLLWKLSYAVSFITVLLMAAAAVFDRRKRRNAGDL